MPTGELVMVEPVKSTIAHTKKALDYVGRTLQLDIYYFVRGGFWLSFSNLLSGLIAFFVIVAFTHLTTKEFYGQYQFVLTVVTTLQIFSLPGMPTAIVQSVARGLSRAFIQATKVRFFYSFIGSIALFLFAGYLKYVRPNEIWYLFVLSAVFFPFLFSFNGCSAYFIGKKQFKAAAFPSLIGPICVGLSVLAAVIFVRSLFWIVGTYLAVTSLINLILYAYIAKQNLKGKYPSIVHYGWHLSFMNGIQVIGLQIDRLVVPYFLGFEQLAIYAVASSLPEALKGFMKISSSLLLPKFSALKKLEVYSQVKTRLFLIFLLSIAASLIGVALSPFVVPLFFSSAYANAVSFTQVLFLSIAVGLPSSIFLTVLEARKNVKAMYSYNVVFMLLSILLFVILTPIYGLLGACTAKLIARYIGFIQLWLGAKRS